MRYCIAKAENGREDYIEEMQLAEKLSCLSLSPYKQAYMLICLSS
jgi:hypothetical protein